MGQKGPAGPVAGRFRRAARLGAIEGVDSKVPLWGVVPACYNSLTSQYELGERGLALQRIRDYELMMILSPEATDEQAAAVVEGVGSYVTERGGSLQSQETWGVRRLAYPIQRYQEGSYMLSWFALDPQDVLELDRTLEASATVLRHLVTKMDKNASRPKVEVAKKPAEAAAVAEKPDAPEGDEQ